MKSEEFATAFAKMALQRNSFFRFDCVFIRNCVPLQ